MSDPDDRHSKYVREPGLQLEDGAARRQAKQHSQDLHDEVLEETFPASDPVAPFVAAHPRGR